MLTLRCTVRSTINQPSSVVAGTGEVRPAKVMAQVEVSKPNGQIEISRIKIEPAMQRTWDDAISERVSVPVNIWSSGGQWGYWLDSGTVPELIDDMVKI